MSAKKERFFKQIEGRRTITVICPDCGNYFGLDRDFVEKAEEVLIQYTCPYCDKHHLLEQ